MRHKIIFIGGVHGVGKSTFCHSAALKFNAKHHSASELISKATQNKNNKNKRTNRINENQEVLLQAINELLDSQTLYFLDGHFCLLNKKGAITRIPSSTYKNIFPIAFITLYDEPINIFHRLHNRDNETHEVDLIAELQKQELKYSEEIATSFGTPYLTGNPFENRDQIIKFIDELLGKESV